MSNKLCQRFYALLFIKEFGFDQNITSKNKALKQVKLNKLFSITLHFSKVNLI